MNTPLDAARREAALDPARSFCVTAPAGSGKTELLSQRVLALLARVQQPEEILAITFTRKAAAEMRERILQALRAAQGAEPDAPHKRQTWRLARAALEQGQTQGWHLLQNPQRLRVQTIDGLCSSLTAQMPVLSQFGGQPRITERAQPLYREATESLLQKLESGDVPGEGAPGASSLGESLGELLLHLDNRVERVHELLASLLACRDQWLPHIAVGMVGAGADQSVRNAAVRSHLETTLRRVREDALEKLCGRMSGYAAELLPLLDFAAVRLREDKPDHALSVFAGCVELPAADAAAVEQWQVLAQWLLTNQGGWRKRITKNEGFPPGAGEQKALFKERKVAMEALLAEFENDDGLRELLDEVRTLPSACYPDSQWRILVQLTRVLAQAVAELDVVFQLRGEVDFTEVSLAAARALGSALDPSELMLRLDQRISHLLVDEFQDTSSTQFGLLKRLVEGWREHNESGAAPRTLFIVGDGMQSIYGFREARVGLFLEAREQGVNQVELCDAPLSVNFRSTPTVVDWNNRVFAQAFPHIAHLGRGAVPYANAFAFNADTADSEVVVYGMRGDPGRTAEAQRVVELVRQSLRRDADGSIAILVRSRSHLAVIVPALQRADIAFRATDIDPLAQRAHVRDLLVLFKALMNPADRIAWLALLRSPLIGLDNRDLHALAAGGDGRAMHTPILSRLRATDVRPQLSAAAAQRIAAVIDILDLALAQRARKSLRTWLEGVWIALGGDLLAAATAAQADVQTALELIEACGGSVEIRELEQRLQTLYARPAAALDARVVLMTIHKSKGLEFDTVIVPALDAGARADDKPLLRWSEYLADSGELGIALAVRAAGGADDAIYHWLEYEHKQQKRLEDTRLLYVAATRAVKRLYLLFSVRGPDDGRPEQDYKGPPANSLLSRIWPAVCDETVWIDAAARDAADVADALETLQRVPLQWYTHRPATIAAGVADNPPQAIAQTLEAQIGSALHSVLEMLARFGTDHWDGHTEAQRATLVTQILRQLGVAEQEIDTACAQIVQTLATMLGDARGRWLLSSAHGEAVAEWELLADGRRYVVDRSFVETHGNDDAGTRWIVDYKNSIPRADESIDRFAQRELEAYRAQLQTYRDFVAAFEARPIRTALYFPRIAHWAELV